MKKLNLFLVVALLATLFSASCGTMTDEGLLFKTADPGLTIGFRWAVPPLPAPEPSLLPTITPEPCLDIKGNISASGEKIYHVQGGANYTSTKIDKEGESWFCSEEEAVEAGFRKAGN